MSRKKNKPNYDLLVRSTEGRRLVQVWLRRIDGGAHSRLLYGECLPATADATSEATGLAVTREEREAIGPATEPRPSAYALGVKDERERILFILREHSDYYLHLMEGVEGEARRHHPQYQKAYVLDEAIADIEATSRGQR